MGGACSDQKVKNDVELRPMFQKNGRKSDVRTIVSRYTHSSCLVIQRRMINDEYVRMCDCCLEGIELCECKGNGDRWISNQVFRLADKEKK
jgi:hypothetical protein